MSKIEIRERDNLFKKCGIELGQLHYRINDGNDLYIQGSVTLSEDGKIPEDMFLRIKANLCDKNGSILYILEAHSDISFSVTPYDAVTMYCFDISRFLSVEELQYIELYPSFKFASDDD